MADISKITPLGSQTTYNLKDATAREQALIVADQTTQYNYAIAASIEKTSASPTSTPYNDIVIPAGEYHLEFDYNTSAASQFIIAKGHYTTLVNVLPYIPQGTGHYTTTVTLSENASAYYWYCDGTGTLSNIMIMPKSLYDSGFTDYQPYALPNTKITPELIELVDSGAKNLWSFGGSIEKASSGNAINVAFMLKAGTYVFSCKIASGGTGSTQLKFTDGSATGTTIATQTWGNTSAGTMSVTYTLTSDATYVVMYTNGSFSYTECMLCSKAAWDVSQKFVPYRPTYEETVEQVAENENNISSIMMSGTARTANLNNIAVNDFGVYTNNSSNLPSADYCFVRTSVNPEAPTTSRLQEAFVMSTGVSYIRTMGGGEWHNWLQITNA